MSVKNKLLFEWLLTLLKSTIMYVSLIFIKYYFDY